MSQKRKFQEDINEFCEILKCINKGNTNFTSKIQTTKIRHISCNFNSINNLYRIISWSLFVPLNTVRVMESVWACLFCFRTLWSCLYIQYFYGEKLYGKL